MATTSVVEGRRAFESPQTSSSASSAAADDCLGRTENALYHHATQPQSPSSTSRAATAAQHYCNEEPNDREVRHAVQKGDEIRASRAIEYAYLRQDDEEFPGVIPASSNRKIVRTDRPGDLYHV
ncbi:MAG: hypothetical protein SGARI_008115 [Bacillariaceae sp.]